MKAQAATMMMEPASIAEARRPPLGPRPVRWLFSAPVLVGLAAVAVITLFVPWQPAPPTVYKGFDRNLLFVDLKEGWGPVPGTVAVASNLLTLNASPNSKPTVHLVTGETPFKAEFDALVDQLPASPGQGLAVNLWFPATTGDSGITLAVEGGSHPRIEGGTFDRGRTVSTETMAPFQPSARYHIWVDAIPGQSATVSVRLDDGRVVRFARDRSSGLTLFRAQYMNLSVSAWAPTGSQPAVVSLTNYQLALPAQSLLASKVSDWRLIALTALLLVYFVGFVLYQVRLDAIRRWRRQRIPIKKVAIMAILGGLIFAGYARLAPMDGHPYDRLSQETWMYVLQHNGLGSLYDRTLMVPDAAVRGGRVPWSMVGYSYLPVMAYPYVAISDAWTAIGHSIEPMQDRAFLAFWKLVFSSFILVNGALVFYILRRYGHLSNLAASAASLALVLNPAIIFDGVIWGETDAILTTALLLAALGFVSGRSRLGWSALVTAALLKETALIAVPIFLVFALKRFGMRRTSVDAAFGVMLGFVLIAPFVLFGYHPGTSYPDSLVQVQSFAFSRSSWLSGDSFPLWTLVDQLNGLHGFARIWPSVTQRLPGVGIGFSALGDLAILLLLLIGAGSIVRTSRTRLTRASLLLPAALLFIADVFLSTKASARYLTLAIPMLLLCLGISRLTDLVVWIVTAALTLVSIVSMYGLFTIIAVRGEWPQFYGLGNPSTNGLTSAVYAIYTSDLGITFGSLLLLLAVGVLTARLLFRQRILLSAPA